MSSNAHKKTMSVTGVILAGGTSRRMGQNKALIQLGDDSLIGHVIRRIRPVTDELLLITNTPDEYAHLGLPMQGDIVPDAGALGGVYTGLMSASSDAVLCVACDSPFLVPELLTYLVSVLDDYDAVMPWTYSSNKGIEVTNPSRRGWVTQPLQITLQTLCAVYSKRCLPIIELMLQASELRVHALQERASIKCIAPEIWQAFDPDGISFFNINTPEDLAQADAYVR